MADRKKVRKAVIAAAGFGTRFLPQTKAMPKEMLPLVDKPIIQHIVEELVEAGIEDIVIVTGYHKRSIEDHFDHTSAELRANLKQAGKLKLLEETRKISQLANFAYIRQKGLTGNATPLLNAEHLIGDEPLIYTFADDFIDATPSRFRQMIDIYQAHGSSVVSCVEVTQDQDYDKYGFVSGEPIADGLLRMSTIIEKPGKASAPSKLASVSGFLLTPEIFPYLNNALTEVEAGEEFKIQPVMQKMISESKQFLAYQVKSAKYYDTGDKLEYLKTVVEFALKNTEIKDEFRDYLKKIVQ